MHPAFVAEGIMKLRIVGADRSLCLDRPARYFFKFALYAEKVSFHIAWATFRALFPWKASLLLMLSTEGITV